MITIKNTDNFLINLGTLVFLLGFTEHAVAHAKTDNSALLELKSQLADDDGTFADLITHLETITSAQQQPLPDDLSARFVAMIADLKLLAANPTGPAPNLPPQNPLGGALVPPGNAPHDGTTGAGGAAPGGTLGTNNPGHSGVTPAAPAEKPTGDIGGAAGLASAPVIVSQ